MPNLYGKTPASTFTSLLTVDNTSGGFDSSLRFIGDGAGLQTPLQLSTSSVALNGLVWPATGGSVGAYLRVSSISSALEWYNFSAIDVTTALGYTPANAAGGSFSTPVTIMASTLETQVTQITDTSVDTVYTFNTTNGGTAKFLCQVRDTSTNALHSEELLVVTDGSIVDVTGFAVVVTQATLGTFNATMSGSNVILTFQAFTATTKTVTIVATSVT
jgi:hypothetical protein